MRAASVDLARIMRRLRELGDDPSEEAIAATGALFEPLHEREPYAGVTVTRDLAYGSDPKQRLDLFAGSDWTGLRRPVLVFAHGGGYISGDRRLAQPSYYDNVALWAVRHGFIGLTMSYRLLPQHRWPAGSDDVARVVEWIGSRIAELADPEQIFLSGHSAGAAHIASYLAAHPQAPVRGAIFCSGVYDHLRMEASPRHVAYFGDDPALLAERSSLEGLVAGKVPLLVACAEHDPQKFLVQFRLLVDGLMDRRGRLVPAICLAGHTHFSTVFHLNAIESGFSAMLLSFIENALAA